MAKSKLREKRVFTQPWSDFCGRSLNQRAGTCAFPLTACLLPPLRPNLLPKVLFLH